MDKKSRFRGSMIGLATGDALGATIEFKMAGTYPLMTDIIGGGFLKLKPRQWTDDTTMALCLAESLMECNGFDAYDQMDRYLKWYRTGYMSSYGACRDIGHTTAKAMDKYAQFRNAYSGATEPNTAGNGSIMRLAPVPLFFSNDYDAAVEHAALSSKTPHVATEAVDAYELPHTKVTGFLHSTKCFAFNIQLLKIKYEK